LNAPVPPAFRESVRYAEQNLYTRARELVGDRDPRSHEFSVQLRAIDNDHTGSALGLPALMALCGGLLEKSAKGGLIVVGALNLGGSVEPLTNAVGVVEVAVEKGANTVLMPVSARKRLFELSDDMATRINVQFYSDTPDALLKALLEYSLPLVCADSAAARHCCLACTLCEVEFAGNSPAFLAVAVS